MKKLKKEGVVFTITVMLGILSFFAVGINILALHDIHKDYASLELLKATGNSPVKPLPAWSHCPMEWSVVWYGHLVLGAFFIFLIIYLLKKNKTRPVNP